MIGRSRPRTTGKNKKAGKRRNPNRPRSRSNPVGKRKYPRTGRSAHNGGRRAGGLRHAGWVRGAADKAREIMGMPQGRRDRRVSAIPVSPAGSEENLSHWGLVRHFAKRPGDLERCGPHGPHGRAQHRLHVPGTGPRVRRRIATRVAGEEAAHGTKIADPGGYGTSRYTGRQNAKYGRPGVQDFARLHLIHTPRGKICAAMAAPGKANDSPYPRKMTETVPTGSGGAPDGAAYGGARNRSAIRDLEGADLEGADLEGADLEGADLEGADLEGADMHVRGRQEPQRHT